MIFGRKKPAETPQEKKPVSHFAQAREFEAARYDLIAQSERKAWLTAKLLGVSCVSLALAIAMMMPLKQTQPYVVQVDKSTGLTEILPIANTRDVPVSEVMDKYWLAQYVTARESYDWHLIQTDFDKTRELSVPDVFAPYAAQFGKSGSLDQQLGNSKRIVVELRTIVLTGQDTATVRFVKKTVDVDTGRELSRNAWIATIGYEYHPEFKLTEARRLVNPFGFKIVSYRVDPEIGDNNAAQ